MRRPQYVRVQLLKEDVRIRYITVREVDRVFALDSSYLVMMREIINLLGTEKRAVT